MIWRRRFANYRTLNLCLSVVIAFHCYAVPMIGAEPTAISFSRDILPILSENCFQCHGPDPKTRAGDLRLDVKEGALRPDQPVIVPGRSGDSELIRRLLTSNADEHMPPAKSNRHLTAQQIDLLRTWIDTGAAWGKHWAYEPPQPPRIPVHVPLMNEAGVTLRSPVDAFVQSRLQAEQLFPAPLAERTTLLRRMTLDLTGLPPTLEQADAFLADDAPDAFERAADRLLASPRFGERMVWEWLDAARYADSNGYQGDGERTMWPWRDWVVRAFNQNLPFDQFTLWQLAGDLLPDATAEQRLATGFGRNHMINGEGGRIAAENRVDYVMDMAETTGTVWLGLTFNCCRCHDHKFDPLTQRDYYQLFAFFNNTPVDGGGGNPQTPPVLEVINDNERQQLAELNSATMAAVNGLTEFENNFFPRPADKSAADSEIAATLPENVKNILKTLPTNRSNKQLEELEKHWEKTAPEFVAKLQPVRTTRDARDAFNRKLPRVMVMEEIAKPRETFVLDKGAYDKPLDKVGIGVPVSLPQLPSDGPANRLGLARWLVSAENPLTARVIVNRFWQQLFGIGLVKTAEDFGVQGEKPVQPELLDWLATEFVRTGWDVKQLQRTLVTSHTYRQSSRTTAAQSERDPENRLLARGSRFRLPAWMLRDQALAASGLLSATVGGNPVKPYQPSGVWEEATFGNKKYQVDKGENLYRRSVYTFWRRIVGPTMFFDSAARQTCSVKQSRTNTPLHALATLNDTTYIEAARTLAETVLTATPNDEQRLDLVFRRCLVRAPRTDELAILLPTLQRLRQEFSSDQGAVEKLLSLGESRRNQKLEVIEHAAWLSVCSLIMNLDESLTKE